MKKYIHLRKRNKPTKKQILHIFIFERITSYLESIKTSKMKNFQVATSCALILIMIATKSLAQTFVSTKEIFTSDQLMVPTMLGEKTDNPVKIKSDIHDTNGKILSKKSQNSTFQVTYTGFSQAAQEAFQHAVDIWEATIHSDVPIRVDAKWSALGYNPNGINTLGSAGPGPTFFQLNGPDVFPNTLYPIALVNKITGLDNDPANPHILAEFNSDIPFWYFGTDANPGAGQSDFVSVVLHEIAHGLGFLGGAMSNSIYFGANNTIPIVYSQLVEEGDGTSILTYPHNSADLIAALIGGDLFYNGPFTVANFGSRPELFAPNPFDQGSSYGHLNPIASSPLMEPSIDPGEAKHMLSDFELGMFYDMGWDPDPGNPLLPLDVCNHDITAVDLGSRINGENAGGIWVVNAGGLQPTAGFDAGAGTFVPNGNATGTYIFDYTFPLGISASVTLNLIEISSGIAASNVAVCNTDTNTIVLSQSLTGADTGGSWTLNPGSLVPASGFNGASGTFTPDGNTAGDYFFDYTVSDPRCTSDKSTTIQITLNACPANDLCTNAQEIFCGNLISGTTNFATNEVEPDCDGGTADQQGVWYKFTGNGGHTVLSTCSANTNFDTELRVFEGTCGNFICAPNGLNDDDFDCSFNIRHSLIEFFAELGKEYHIWVSPYATNQPTGDFELSISCDSCSDMIDTDNDGIAACFDLCPTVADASLNFEREGNFAGNTSDHIEVPHNPAFNLSDGDFAFEAWIYPKGTDGNSRAIVSKGHGGNSNTVYIFEAVADPDSEFGQAGKLGLFLGDVAGNTEWQFSDSKVPPFTWSHVAVSVEFSGSSPIATFYLNGNEDGIRTYSDTQAPLFNTDTNPLYIGRQGWSCDCNFMDGRIDEVAIWDRAISQPEMQASIDGPYLGNEFGLIAYYDFNDEDACVANNNNIMLTDKASGYDGTLTNFALTAGCSSNWAPGHNVGDCEPVCQSNLADNLVSYWNFDNTIVDHQGPNNGSHIGNGSTYETGVFDNCIKLDGVSSYVSVGNDPSLNFENKSISISAWFKVDQFDTPWQTLISKGEGANFRIARHATTNEISYNGGFPDVIAPININDEQFHHMVAVTEANVSKSIYLDGRLILTEPFGVNIIDGARDLLIGNNPDILSRIWNGWIDDVAIWDIPLSSCDVNAIFSSGQSLADMIGLDTCPSDYEGLTGNHATNSIYETDGEITSDQVIGEPADIIYDSATHIELNQGFEVNAGSLFHAFIDGCN